MRSGRRAWLAACLLIGGQGCEEPAASAAAALEPVEDPEMAAQPQPTVQGPQAPEPYAPELLTRKRVVDVRFEWPAVPGARSYQVQVSKMLTFTRLRADLRTTVTEQSVVGIKPGVYFWRICAAGDAGSGEPACSRKAVLNASLERRGVRGWGRKGRMGRRGGGRSQSPAERFSSPTVVVPEPQGLVEEPAAAPEPRAEKKLPPIGPVRKRYLLLQAELAEIKALRRDLAATIRELESQLAEADAGAEVAQMREELNRIETSRAELDREVTSAIAELDHLLGD